MERKICNVSVTYRVATTGMLGDRWEWAPYMTSHATFGAQRMSERDPMKEVVEARKTKQTQQPHRAHLGAPKKEAEELQEVKQVTVKRDVRQYEATRALQYELPDYDEMRADDSIKFKLFAHSYFAGVPFLDKAQGEQVALEIPEGLTHLEMIDLFAHYHAHCERNKLALDSADGVVLRIRDQFIDDKIVMDKVRQLSGVDELTETIYNKWVGKARDITAKADVLFEVHITHFNPELYKRSIFAQRDLKKTGLHAMLPLRERTRTDANVTHYGAPKDGSAYAAKEDGFAAILYNSERTQLQMANTMVSVLQLYCDNFIKMGAAHQPRYRPSEPVIQNLQMPMFQSEHGREYVARYWAGGEPFYRQYASLAVQKRELALYALNDHTEAHFLMMLRSSLRRHGLSEAKFTEVTRWHFESTNQSRQMDPLVLLAEEAVADVGTFAANSAYYTADYRFMNLSDHTHSDPVEMTKCTRCGKMTARVNHLDSWDRDILGGVSMCDDCEGQDCAATGILRSYRIGRQMLQFAWKSDTLGAVQLLLTHTSIYDVGALVTSAFMNTDNTKMELQQQDDLPLIGSAMDKNAQNDGHCFFVWQSRQRSIAMLRRGGTAPPDALERMTRAHHISEAFQARERQRTPVVGEGTGSIESRITPLEESYGKGSPLYTRKRAARALVRHARTVVKGNAQYECIAQLFSGEGLAHYVEAQDKKRRLSSFYNSVVHGTDVQLEKEYGSAFSQFAFCKPIAPGQGSSTGYGVRMGELLRDESSTPIALVCPYAGQEKLWQESVAPMVETIENQMPVQRFGRYSEEEYAATYSRYVAPSEVTEEFRFGAPGYKSNNKKREAVESRLFALESDATRSVVRLYSRTWKLNKDVKARATMLQVLKSLPGVQEIAFFEEKHLPNCEAIVEILVLGDAAQWLALESQQQSATGKK